MISEKQTISLYSLKRLPDYLHYLKQILKEGVETVASPKIAKDLGLNDVQVRKDIAMASSGGKSKIGYDVKTLIGEIEQFLGYQDIHTAVLVGAGHLGRALLSFKGFDDYGIRIGVAFDNDERIIGQEINGTKVVEISKISNLCSRLHAHIGIITVPETFAQEICDELIKGGVLAIWNFAPITLNVPEGIIVQNENMAASLAVVSRHLSKKLKKN